MVFHRHENVDCRHLWRFPFFSEINLYLQVVQFRASKTPSNCGYIDETEEEEEESAMI